MLLKNNNKVFRRTRFSPVAILVQVVAWGTCSIDGQFINQSYTSLTIKVYASEESEGHLRINGKEIDWQPLLIPFTTATPHDPANMGRRRQKTERHWGELDARWEGVKQWRYTTKKIIFVLH